MKTYTVNLYYHNQLQCEGIKQLPINKIKEHIIVFRSTIDKNEQKDYRFKLITVIKCSDCDCLIDEDISHNNEGRCEDCFSLLFCSECGEELDHIDLHRGECDDCYRENGGI